MLQEPFLLQAETQCKGAEEIQFDFATFLYTPSDSRSSNSREHSHPKEGQTRFVEPGENAIGKPDVWHKFVMLTPAVEGLFQA
jgi:hypothetical protein